MNLSIAALGGIGELHKIAYSDDERSVFKIPYYQRPYEWDREQIDNLIIDYNKNHNNGTSDEYFIGATVLVTNDKKELEIVDGQQRITTMYLMHMVKFFAQRALVDYELKSSRHIGKVSKDLFDLQKSYAGLVGCRHESDIKNIEKSISDKISLWQESLSAGDASGTMYLNKAIYEYESCMGLSEKKWNDSEFVKDSRVKSRKFWACDNLSISYCREAFNQKLKEALSYIVCVLDDGGELQLYPLEAELDSTFDLDDIVGQYVKAMIYEYQAIKKYVDNTELTGRDKTQKFIEQIDEMMTNIEFCAVVTGSEKDAYALFESLNDRNKAVDDVDLIKNLFFRAYYNKSGDNQPDLEDGLQKIDEIWGDGIFTKQNKSLVSLLGAVYLTGDISIDEKNGMGVRKVIDSFLEKKTKYSLDDVCNDIRIYKMVREIINASSKSGLNSNKNLMIVENDSTKSITCRCLFLLRALNYSNVLAGLVNVIIGTYLKNQKGEIDVNDFKTSFLSELMLSRNQNDAKYRDISVISYDLWRLVMAAEDYKKPREYAITLIEAFHKDKADNAQAQMKYALFSNAMEQLDNWLPTWHYGLGVKDLKLKIFFIRLLKTGKDEQNQLIFNASTTLSLTKPELAELDHLEPKETDRNFKEIAYYQPSKRTTRDEVVDGLGNFLLLDDYNNIKKSNSPLEKAIRYYDKMLNGGTHWLVEEVKQDLTNPKFFKKKRGGLVPVDAFFLERRDRLISYIRALLSSPSYDNKSQQI